MDLTFQQFPKIPRYNRDIIITEKIDGTNAQIHIIGVANPSDVLREDCERKGWAILDSAMSSWVMVPGSKNRYLNLKKDNYGFCKWVWENSEYLWDLGPGRHYGEWWGKGIQRNYGIDQKRFTLFNPHYATKDFHTAPVLYEGPNDQLAIEECLYNLSTHGSVLVKGFMKPEGIIIFHTAANRTFKITLENDEIPKGMQ